MLSIQDIKKINVNEFDMVGRLNGDEFLVSILNATSEYQVEEIAKKIISDFAEINII